MVKVEGHGQGPRPWPKYQPIRSRVHVYAGGSGGGQRRRAAAGSGRARGESAAAAHGGGAREIQELKSRQEVLVAPAPPPSKYSDSMQNWQKGLETVAYDRSGLF